MSVVGLFRDTLRFSSDQPTSQADQFPACCWCLIKLIIGPRKAVVRPPSSRQGDEGQERKVHRSAERPTWKLSYIRLDLAMSVELSSTHESAISNNRKKEVALA